VKRRRDGDQLSSVLGVRRRVIARAGLFLGGDYDRICAGYHLEENSEVPCRIGELA
jgi:hypothetical protein